MKQLPQDIESKAIALFGTSAYRNEAIILLESLWTMPINVGPDQLAHRILGIANDDILVIREISS